MRLVDLFCGAGGAGMGYHLAGFEVVGVDIEPQPNYPFEFVQADAATFDLSTFDFVHASPPCQGHSTLRHIQGNTYDDFITVTRHTVQQSGLPYVIENVVGAPLLNPVRLCGSSFGLGVRRHRLFETNWPLLVPGCDHASQKPKYRMYDHGKWYLSRTAPVYGHGGGKAQEVWSEAMGIDWMTRQELTQAIPPAYTKFIGSEFLVSSCSYAFGYG